MYFLKFKFNCYVDLKTNLAENFVIFLLNRTEDAKRAGAGLLCYNFTIYKSESKNYVYFCGLQFVPLHVRSFCFTVPFAHVK